ncbi:unnamed protein product [Soboliphyme baturini]|uniref:CID domain-containing protein n=1 Tax=Soboliphyme baturini TaxID=241478 RepID=A0A183J2S0_9BILA|nr:unnamed protein product [Soboliphyme baturini]
MAAFSEIIVQRKLQELTNTKQSIQTLSLWLLHHRKHAAEIVELWYRQVKREKRSDRLIVLFYLANDVIQNSRRKYPIFAENFRSFVQRAVMYAKQYMDPQAMTTLRRIVEVWEQRSIYSRDFLNVLKSEFASLRKNDSSPQAGALSTECVDPISLVEEIQSPSDTEVVPKEKDMQPKMLRSGSVHVCLPADINKLNEMLVAPPTPSELLQSLQELTNAPSADVAVRYRFLCIQIVSDFLHCQSVIWAVFDKYFLCAYDLFLSSHSNHREKIASFPPDVADVSAVKRITTKEEFEKFRSLVEEAHEVVAAYNERLAEEMVNRRRILQKLDAFIHEQKKKRERDAITLSEWKKKLEMINQERLELLKHIESLPDLSRLPDVSELPPLPSADELFNP